jgi:transcriptional regulator with XRE-family HTH domain
MGPLRIDGVFYLDRRCNVYYCSKSCFTINNVHIMIEQQIAIKIRLLRQSSGLTLEELSRRTGLSKGLLSKVENNKTCPPIATLVKIAEGLGTPIASFFEEDSLPPEPLSLVRKDQREKAVGPVVKSGPYTYFSLTRLRQRRCLEPLIVVFEPGKRPASDRVEHLGEELIFVLKGRLQFFYARNAYVLEPGDAIHFDPSLPHKASALDNAPAECLIVVGTPG